MRQMSLGLCLALQLPHVPVTATPHLKNSQEASWTRPFKGGRDSTDSRGTGGRGGTSTC